MLGANRTGWLIAGGSGGLLGQQPRRRQLRWRHEHCRRRLDVPWRRQRRRWLKRRNTCLGWFDCHEQWRVEPSRGRRFNEWWHDVQQ